MQAHLASLFPDGVTHHGDQYFVTENRALDTSAAIELLFEMVRRADFVERPSRYQSFFAATDVDHARAFGRTYGHGRPFSIWEVEASEGFEADMNLITTAARFSSLGMSLRAADYWAGRTSPGSPLLEVLLKPPVRVVEQVEEWDYQPLGD
ncbi:MAG: DUF2441 domain-containing protein [Acidimicrobiia bacterium]